MENKKFNKILIVRHEKQSPKHEETVAKVMDILKKSKKDFSCIKFNELHDCHFEDKDLVITIGGDGTFIRTSHFMRGDTPILGINSEPETSEGALTTLNQDEVECIKDILKGDYEIIKRLRARVIRNGELVKELALNEVYVGAANQFHTSRYVIKHRNEEEEHRSSGVLVVTGAGSRAWYLSAGGEPFAHDEPKLKFLVREPFVSRIFQPKLTKGEIEKDEKIIFESKREDGGVISVDSWAIYDFNKGDTVEVRLSSQPLNVITKNNKNGKAK
jgi:NAD+ kinase